MIGVGAIACEFPIWTWSVCIGCADVSSFEDVGIWCGDGFEDRLVYTKILGKNGWWGMGNPIVNVERGSCGVEVACKRSSKLRPRKKR